jgi:restriction system protein
MDLLISKKGKEAIVQCKHWKGRVGVTVVREMFGLMHAHKHKEVFIIALSGFTKQANDWAEGKPIRLIVPESF